MRAFLRVGAPIHGQNKVSAKIRFKHLQLINLAHNAKIQCIEKNQVSIGSFINNPDFGRSFRFRTRPPDIETVRSGRLGRDAATYVISSVINR